MENNKRKLIIDGKFIDLDKMPIEELKKIQENLTKREEEIRKQIEKELESYQ